MTFRACAAVVASLAAVACAACNALQPATTQASRPRCPSPAPHAAPLPAPRGSALLPVSLPSLQAAAALAARFAFDYATSRPGESPRAWLARLRPLATAQLAAALARAAPWQTRHPAASHILSEHARDLSPQAAVFTVRLRQHADGTGSTAVLGYAVTVVRRAGGGWAVYDIEPASAGNAG